MDLAKKIITIPYHDFLKVFFLCMPLFPSYYIYLNLTPHYHPFLAIIFLLSCCVFIMRA